MAEKVKDFMYEHMSHKICTLKTTFNTNGIRGLTDSIAADVSACRNIEIKIAVTGRSGAGKSTFINAIRGLDSDSEGAAATGFTETTTEISPYPHPLNENFLFVELPGVGTNRFPRKHYLKQIRFETFDFFIIVSDRRLSENDIWLAKEIEGRGRQEVFFIRTKFESDLHNEMRRCKPKMSLITFEQDRLKTTILGELRSCLVDLNCKDNIFIIDSFVSFRFDFPELEKRLKYDYIMKESITLSLEALTEDVINKKKIIFEDMRWKTTLRALLSHSRESADDLAFLQKVKEIYLEQFNLEAASLKHAASLANITIDKFSEELEIPNEEDDITQEKTYTDEMLSLYYICPSLII